ncbi:MAG: efflux RND transporter permease subunit, partial [Myxococcota bacterium]
MSITSYALRHTRVTGVAIAVLIVAGFSAYAAMPRQMDPGFTVRTARVTTYFSGASPERVEQLVTDPIEEAIQEIPELDYIESISRTGVSIIDVNIRNEFKDMRPIWDNLRRKVEDMQGDLPEEAGIPQVNDEFGDTYGIMYSMTSDGFTRAEMKEIADDVRDELLRVKDVAKVDILGAQDERIFVEYNNAQLAQLGLSPDSLSSVLSARNIIMPGGEFDGEIETIVVEPSGNFVSVEELGRTLIQVPNSNDVVYLADIAEIQRAYVDPPSTIVRTDGKDALVFAVSLSDGGNLIELGKRVDALYDRLPTVYPHGIDFHTVFFEPVTVQAKVDEFLESVIQAVLIVLVVMLLFLGLRMGLVVASLIPTAMIVTVFVLSIIDVSIDQMTLAALIIALGLLVDNAIVVSESITVRMAQGESGFDAAVGACKELQISLLTSSLTTAAAFLPIYLAEHSVGEYTGVLFVVVTITLLTSWILAITMIALLCAYFLKPALQKGDQFETKFYQGYRSVLLGFLKGRWFSIAAVAIVFVGAMQLFSVIPQIFFPPSDRSMFMATFELTPGTTVSRTDEMSQSVDRFMRDELAADGVTAFTSFVASTPPRFVLNYTPSQSKSSRIEYMIRTSGAEKNASLMKKLERWAIDQYPDVKTHVRLVSSGPPVDRPIEIRIQGRDTDQVFSIVDDVRQKLESTTGTRNISDDWGSRVKKFYVEIDEERARRANMTNYDVATSLQTFLSGLETTNYREDDDVIPVLLRSVVRDRRDIERLETVNVFSQSTGESVPLRQVADIHLEFQPSEVLRWDRDKVVTLEADVAGRTAIDVLDEITPWLDEQKKSWDFGYRYEYGGEIESSGESSEAIGAKLPISGLLIIMLLVWQFNSLRKASIVLTAIPLALIGVVLGLLAMNSYFGFMTLLGIVSLAGIVINNAIVLIDRIQLEIDENGLSPAQAVIQSAQQRLRPILLTTATTIASLIPLYISGGPMWEPMCVAIMFGLVFS